MIARSTRPRQAPRSSRTFPPKTWWRVRGKTTSIMMRIQADLLTRTTRTRCTTTNHRTTIIKLRVIWAHRKWRQTLWAWNSKATHSVVVLPTTKTAIRILVAVIRALSIVSFPSRVLLGMGRVLARQTPTNAYILTTQRPTTQCNNSKSRIAPIFGGKCLLRVG